MKTTFVALAGDHALILNSIANLIGGFDGFEVLFHAKNGSEFISLLDPQKQPDIVLIDVNMPDEVDGYETAGKVHEFYPDIKILVLVSLFKYETTVARMIENGACGYILKNLGQTELRTALCDVVHKGYYPAELWLTNRLLKNIKLAALAGSKQSMVRLSAREIEFLKLASSELTYDEIAAIMHLSPRTIHGYREALFEKLKVKTRIGLVLYAIKMGISILDYSS